MHLFLNHEGGRNASIFSEGWFLPPDWGSQPTTWRELLHHQFGSPGCHTQPGASLFTAEAPSLSRSRGPEAGLLKPWCPGGNIWLSCPRPNRGKPMGLSFKFLVSFIRYSTSACLRNLTTLSLLLLWPQVWIEEYLRRVASLPQAGRGS